MFRQILLLISLAISTILASNSSSYVDNFTLKSKAEFFYTVSSIEMQPTTTFDIDFDGTVEINIQRCEDAVPKNSIAENHILIYPEYSLSSNKIFNDRDLARNLSQNILAPEELISPCNLELPDATHKMLKRMSCLAIRYNVYIVAHFIEREDCEDCELDKLKLYSTAVAFNRLGVVIAKYRKFHMFSETSLDPALSIELATFTTDFNVTFGIVMSFDLMFVSPAMLLTEVANVTEILVPYAFAGVLPFLTPLQMQYGWSYVNNDVNVITACYLRPSEGYSGCGMYFGENRGYMIGITYSDIIIYSATTINVKKIERKAQENSINLQENDSLVYDSENMTDYVSVTLEKSFGFQEIEACHNTLCCQLNFTLVEYPDEEINYKLLVFDGIKHHPSNGRSWSTQMCGLVACTPGIEGNIACADMPLFESYSNFTAFGQLSLSGNFNSSYVFPTSFLTNFRPFEQFELIKEEDVENDKFNVLLHTPKTVKIIKNIQTFGLYSHDLESFYSPPEKDSSNVNLSNLIVISLLSLCILLL